jgi:hypothetical protein
VAKEDQDQETNNNHGQGLIGLASWACLDSRIVGLIVAVDRLVALADH